MDGLGTGTDIVGTGPKERKTCEACGVNFVGLQCPICEHQRHLDQQVSRDAEKFKTAVEPAEAPEAPPEHESPPRPEFSYCKRVGCEKPARRKTSGKFGDYCSPICERGSFKPRPIGRPKKERPPAPVVNEQRAPHHAAKVMEMVRICRAMLEAVPKAEGLEFTVIVTREKITVASIPRAVQKEGK